MKKIDYEHFCSPKQEVILGDNKRIELFNTKIDVLTVEETVALVDKYVKCHEPLHLIGINADKINELQNNRLLKEIVNSCGVINADGASIVIASRILNKPLPERVAGIDLMMSLVSLSNENGYSIYLLGAKQNVVDKTKEVLLQQFPNLHIVGIRNGYFGEDEWTNIVAELKEKKPDFVFVGITSPLKEYFVEFMQNNGIKSVFMGVGGSFDVISGNIPRAPLWMQNANLEWLFRVIQEPRRLFKRYFIGNFVFIKRVIREKLK